MWRVIQGGEVLSSTHIIVFVAHKKEEVVRVRLELTTLMLSAHMQYRYKKKKLSL